MGFWIERCAAFERGKRRDELDIYSIYRSNCHTNETGVKGTSLARSGTLNSHVNPETEAL